MSKSALAFTAAALLAFVGLTPTAPRAAKARAISPPAADQPAGATTSEVVVLAAGCFWGVQGVYQHLNGVVSAVSGYAGGEKNTAAYHQDFLTLNPANPYIIYNDMPKIENLKRLFPDLYRRDPVLVRAEAIVILSAGPP